MKKLIITLALVFAAVCGVSAGVIKGRIACEGKGVAGVNVSDGVNIVKTDKKGNYKLKSDKTYGYVFYSLPSGYEPETEDTFKPLMWALLDRENPQSDEVHDFNLKKRDNDKCIILFSSDHHLANRVSDLEQCELGFIRSVKNFVKENNSVPVYSIFLGDSTWDGYWYMNNFAPVDYMNKLKEWQYPTMIFHTMGNHDNNPAVPEQENVDELAAWSYRDFVAPSFYSFNIGRNHIIMLDNVQYINHAKEGKKYNPGVVGGRNYFNGITDEQYEWLKKDLATVTDKSTPIFVCMHVRIWRFDPDKNFELTKNLQNGGTDKIAQAFADFSDVRFMTGHAHINQHYRPTEYPNIHEHNVGAVCGTWWNSGFYTDRDVCRDGTPGGYAVYEIDGKKAASSYHASNDRDNRPCRVYDMNSVAEYYRNSPLVQRMIRDSKTKRTDFGKIEPNVVMLNVYNYDSDWKVEVIEDGKSLPVVRCFEEDPMHTMAYDIPKQRQDGEPVSAGSCSMLGANMFKAQAATATHPVTIRLTDSAGRVYTEVVERPKKWNVEMD